MCKFKYFVSYSYSSNYGCGFGNVEINLKKAIKSMEDIREIEEYIMSNCSGDRRNFKTAVLHWRKFGKE
jgi:hypothetical protein